MHSSFNTFKFYKYKPLESLHIELTSKCALKCLRCSRTIKKGTYRIKDLPLDLIRKRLHANILKGVNFIQLAGNYGDPIYYKHFFEVLEYLKSHHCRIYIETNGSGKNASFWKQIISTLDNTDVISFSVDGLKDTNSIYRVNSKWDSIQKAMEIVSQSQVQAYWKFIIFKHNQHQIKEAQEFSNHLGISRFIIVKSALFGKHFYNEKGIDPLMPEKKWIKTPIRNNQAIKESNFKIYPKCLNTGLHYISAEGYYFPCCWIGHYHITKVLFSENEIQSLSLYKHSLENILQGKTLQKLESLWKNRSKIPSECMKKCQYTNSSFDKSRSFHERITI